MKSLKFILLLLLCAVTFNSCKKGYDTGVTDTSDYVTTLKVDGVTKTTTKSFGSIYSSGNTFQLLGQFADGSVVSVMVSNVAVGSFDVAKTNSLLSYGIDSTYDNTYLGTSGTVTITVLTSDTISGTFQFVGTGTSSSKGTKTINEGSFKAKYTKI